MISPGRPVRDIGAGPGASVDGIVRAMSESGGFGSVDLADGVGILDRMIRDEECLRFVSFVGAVVSTGLRGVIRDMLSRGWFDVAMTTCGALDHDIARYFAEYREGSFTMDDVEVAEAGMHRLGSVLVPEKNYGPLIEEKMQGFLEAEYQKGVRRMGTAQICRMIGDNLGDGSFLHGATKRGTDVVVPGIMDGAVGSQIWMFTQKHRDFVLDMAADAELLSGRVFKAGRSGALMIGGGISKHHTLWWNQYRGGLEYAFYITEAHEYDGSLSGAPVREAVSWGKVARGAGQATLRADATVVLPFIHAALVERLG
ncbi:MAG: deoxyhypusine synthase [Nitrosopumilus sp.]|nr:deoxyhypusine synthase [Nitrosopumilus sp.]MDA7997128.1 deoxyhypusine synthase [Nitrosopumilus sp.]